MSDTEGGAEQPRRHREQFGSIVIVGGGCYGSYYVRQLQRAARAGAISAAALLVVDRDSQCAVAREAADPGHEPWPIDVDLRCEDWRLFFAHYLSAAASEREMHVHDAIVPSPLMPHLMAEWLIERARRRWPSRSITTLPLDATPNVPWQRAGADGTHYVSFADWICPINCIEPRICPHTRGPRDWSLATWLPEFAAATGRASSAPRGAVVLHCRHRAYGVGMFDTAEVVAADDAIRDLGTEPSAEVLIGTVSHCHGAITRLVIDAGEPATVPAATRFDGSQP